MRVDPSEFRSHPDVMQIGRQDEQGNLEIRQSSDCFPDYLLHSLGNSKRMACVMQREICRRSSSGSEDSLDIRHNSAQCGAASFRVVACAQFHRLPQGAIGPILDFAHLFPLLIGLERDRRWIYTIQLGRGAYILRLVPFRDVMHGPEVNWTEQANARIELAITILGFG